MLNNRELARYDETNKIDLNNLMQINSDAMFNNIVSIDMFKDRYFLAYVVGLGSAYIYPIYYLLTDPASSLNSVNTALRQVGNMVHPISILSITLYTADNVGYRVTDQFKKIIKETSYKIVLEILFIHNLLFFVTSVGWQSLVYDTQLEVRTSCLSNFMVSMCVRGGVLQNEAIVVYFIEVCLRCLGNRIL